MPRRSASASSGIGVTLAGLTLLLIVGVVHGGLAFGCYLVNEHRRLAWHEIALLWFGDVLGLLWFLQFSARWWLTRGEFAEEVVVERRGLPRSAWMMMLSLGLGMLAEFSLTLHLTYDESVGFARAVPAVCQLTVVRPQTARGIPTYWKLEGDYVDNAGQSHRVAFYLRERDELHKLPAMLVAAIQQRQLPLALPVIYDPQRPSRSWIPELGWDDGNRLHYLSLLILLFQSLLTVLFMLLLSESIKQRGRIPAWSEMHRLLPLATEAFIMALFGGLELYVVRRFCP